MSAVNMTTTDAITVRPSDAARMIGFSKRKLYGLISAGEIQIIKVGKSTLIEVAELHRWVERQKAA